MKFINYTNDGRVVIQHAALILSKLDETDTLELHTMDTTDSIAESVSVIYWTMIFWSQSTTKNPSNPSSSC